LSEEISSSQEEHADGIYSVENYPNKPKTAEETLVAFWFTADAFLRGEKNIEEAMSFVEENSQELNRDLLYKDKERGPWNIKAIEILSPVVIQDTFARIPFCWILESGSTPSMEATLKKVDGRWKLTKCG
jgi:hypothetical protein